MTAIMSASFVTRPQELPAYTIRQLEFHTSRWYGKKEKHTWSTVTAVMSARFLTRPQDSPSGVSAGHSTPHWLGCRLRGPLTCEILPVALLIPLQREA